MKKQTFQLLEIGEHDYQLFRNNHPTICPFQPMQISQSNLSGKQIIAPPACTTNCPFLTIREDKSAMRANVQIIVELSCGDNDNIIIDEIINPEKNTPVRRIIN